MHRWIELDWVRVGSSSPWIHAPYWLGCFLLGAVFSCIGGHRVSFPLDWPARDICFPLLCFCFLILMGEVTLLPSSDSGFPSHLAMGRIRRVLKKSLVSDARLFPLPARAFWCPTYTGWWSLHTYTENLEEIPFIYFLIESFQVDKMTNLQIIVRKGLNKCIAINNYQDTQSGNDHAQIFTPKDLSCINLDWLNNPLVLT